MDNQQQPQPMDSANRPTHPDRLRDPIWQFIAVPVAVILFVAGIVWGYYTFVITKPVKSLAIVVLSSNSLVQVQEGLANDIEILYKGQPVRNLSVVTVKLENTGNQAIREADYARPIALAFPTGSKIVNTGVTESNPPNVGMTVQASQNIATLSQALLNVGDRVIIELVITDLPRDAGSVPFTANARIVEIKSVVPVSAIAEKSRVSDSGVWLYVEYAIALVLVAYLLLSMVQMINAYRHGRLRVTFRTRR